MKLPATRFVPVKMEIGGKPASEPAQAFEQGLPIGCARDHERARTGGVDLDVVALLQLKCFDNGSGETHGEAVAPSGNLHGGYTLALDVYPRQSGNVSTRCLPRMNRRYGLDANQAGTPLATFRAVAKKYPRKRASEILGDLIKTPGHSRCPVRDGEAVKARMGASPAGGYERSSCHSGNP